MNFVNFANWFSSSSFIFLILFWAFFLRRSRFSQSNLIPFNFNFHIFPAFKPTFF